MPISVWCTGTSIGSFCAVPSRCVVRCAVLSPLRGCSVTTGTGVPQSRYRAPVARATVTPASAVRRRFPWFLAFAPSAAQPTPAGRFASLGGHPRKRGHPALGFAAGRGSPASLRSHPPSPSVQSGKPGCPRLRVPGASPPTTGTAPGGALLGTVPTAIASALSRWTRDNPSGCVLASGRGSPPRSDRPTRWGASV